MSNREEQITNLRIEYSMRINRERRDHAISLNRAIEDLQEWMSTELNRYNRFPMTRQGEAIREYIRQYKKQHDNED